MDKKAQKKKDRAKRVRKQILLQREALRAPAREERKLRKRLDRIAKLKKDMGALNVWADDVLLKMGDKTMSQLERNVKILKALEDEHRAEREKKRAVNAELEAGGHMTLDEKLNHLHQKLVAEAKAMYAAGGIDATEIDAAEAASRPSDELKDAIDKLDAARNTEEVEADLKAEK